MATPREGDGERLWPAFAIIALILPVVFAAQIAATVGWLAVRALLGGSTEDGSAGSATEALGSLGDSPGYYLLATVVAQATFAGLALLGVLLARANARSALGLVRGRARGLELPAMLGTLFAAVLSQLWWDLRYDVPSDNLVAIGKLVTDTPPAMFAAILVAFSVLPGVCEELLFRGFLQRRLLRRWSAGPAVGLTSLLFAGVHLDPQHIWSVVPLSLWLGYVGWRSGALLPAILCHAFNNAFSILMMRLEPSTVDSTSGAWTLAMSAVGLPALLWTAWQLERHARSTREPAP